ncbi:unnamed protein product, partial [Brachionus calyciflorus]
SIDLSEKSDEINIRIRNLNSHFTYLIYTNICQSLFEKDKFLFSFLLCTSVLKANDDIDQEELRFFLTGGVSIENNLLTNPYPKWLPEKTWLELNKLNELKNYTLVEHLRKNEENWKNYYLDPDSCKIPYEKPLTKFIQLIILKIFRPDKIIQGIRKFIIQNLGSKFIEPPAFSLVKLFNNSKANLPLIFILSPGSDPLTHLYKLANDYEMVDKIRAISLGQGQGPIALKQIEEAIQYGHWVILQNCHLATSFLNDIERVCQNLTQRKETIKPEFRLWLTSYSTPEFPVSVLENSIKITNEAPKGLRSNLLKIYLNDPISNSKYFNSCFNNDIKWKKLLFSLCFFHAVVEERKKYGPIGWNIPYEFNESDLNISIRQLKLFLDSYENIQLDALIYLTAECNYGGRVTDIHDRRLIVSLLNVFYCEKLFEHSNYNFFNLDNYYTPNEDSYDMYLEYIRSLPFDTPPEAFGLHSNSELTRTFQETQQLFNGILLTLPRENSLSNQNSNQNFIQEIIKDILKRLPKEFDIKSIQKFYPLTYSESMNTVLIQELTRYNNLLICIKDSLNDVKKALKGQILITSNLEQVTEAILMNKIPDLWASKSYPSLKSLGNYIPDLCQRLKFFQDWIDKDSPVVFWLSGFFFIQSFLTGITQNYARKYKIPIDELKFEFKFLNVEPKLKPQDGAYVKGIYLQGARWCTDTNLLKESIPKIIYDKLPVIHLIPNKLNFDNLNLNYYECPVYKTSLRRGELSTTGHSTNYVFSIHVPIDNNKSHWINRGVVGLCQLDD